MKLMNVKGTYDFLPNEMKIRNFITDTLRKNFEKYSYLPLETPILNYFDLLSYKYKEDAEILHEIYRLTDQGDRDLGLRYDLTVPFCKVVGLTKDLSLPFRRYEIGKVFRNGPVKPGRTREFYQCDVDEVGIDGRVIEAEQIMMGINTFKDLGIDVITKVNNRKLLTGLIKYVGINENLYDSIIGVIDHKEKMSYEDLINYMVDDYKVDKDVAVKLLSLCDMSLDELDNLDNKNDLMIEGISELKEVFNLLDKLNMKDNYVFTPTLARGLSIYTGVVFEFFDKRKRINSSLGGGGRYDKIITDFMNDGNLYPACGFSFGLEPIYTILKEEMSNNSLIDIYLVPLDTNIEVLKLATELRNIGLNTLIEMNNRKVGKCFNYAERENIKYVMIIGSDEVNNNQYRIKDMIKKEEYTFSLDELINYLKNN